MAKLEEYCEVRTESGIYRDWTTVAVSYTTGDNTTPRKFSLTTAEPSDRTVFRIAPGDRVDIALAGNVVISNGRISDRQAAFDANRHGVRLDGYGKDGEITKASVDIPGGELRNYTLDAIANRVLRPHGVRFRMPNPPPGADLPFPRVSVRRGETPLDLLSRLAKQRGVRLTSKADGTVIGGLPAITSEAISFEEGGNILSATCHITLPYAAKLIGDAQTTGSDSLFGKKVAEVRAIGGMTRGVEGLVKKFTSEMPAQPKEMQGRVNMALADLQAATLKVNIVQQGWLRPGGKSVVGDHGLFELGEPAVVRSPMLFPMAEGEMKLRIWSVTYSQDAQAGTTTGIELVNEAAWGILFPDAKAEQPFFNQPTTPAQPQDPT